VTFAFGHCTTICPAVVHQARQTRLEAGEDLAIVVLTLDPWRDTPSRLPALLVQFGLDPERDFVVGGGVEAVNEALDSWGIPRERDEVTGDVIHPGIVYMVEPDGTVAFGSTGGIAQMVSLVGRLRVPDVYR
jgi:cytochrome oxidase Cu insertion factor (SCO1/SenC/PrrC family)